jgi:hypothetical protein
MSFEYLKSFSRQNGQNPKRITQPPHPPNAVRRHSQDTHKHSFIHPPHTEAIEDHTPPQTRKVDSTAQSDTSPPSDGRVSFALHTAPYIVQTTNESDARFTLRVAVNLSQIASTPPCNPAGNNDSGILNGRADPGVQRTTTEKRNADCMALFCGLTSRTMTRGHNAQQANFNSDGTPTQSQRHLGATE